MFEKMILLIATWIVSLIARLGYTGIVLLMAIESACIPLPSEIIMPFAGFLVFKGILNLNAVAVAGALGCVLGSIPAYYLGALGGRPMVVRYGHWVFISSSTLTRTEQWFTRYGELTIFIGRLLPLIRTFIAFPAGVAHMNKTRFVLYTFAGSWIWCWLLAYAGMKFGSHWQDLKIYFHQFHLLLIGIALLLLMCWVWLRTRSC